MKKYDASYNNILRVALEASDTVSSDFSAKVKPLIKVLVYFGTLLLLVVVIPTLSISRLIRKKPNAFNNLQVELETKWHSESSIAALNALRDVYAELKGRLNDLHFKGIYIQPYGNFKFMEYLSVLELLYHYEMRHRNWDESIEVCNTLMEPLLAGKDKMKGALDRWIVYKAKALYKLKGNAAAQEYLLRNVDHSRDKNPINTYLFELRDLSRRSREK